MAMNFVNSDLFHTTTLVITVLHLLLSPASCVDQPRPSLAPQGFLAEEKPRLGSTPPRCHSKCNECHPCIAVQVATQQSHDPVQPGLRRTRPMELEPSSSTAGNKYSNYKPMGWKCRCGNHLFNP